MYIISTAILKEVATLLLVFLGVTQIASLPLSITYDPMNSSFDLNQLTKKILRINELKISTLLYDALFATLLISHAIFLIGFTFSFSVFIEYDPSDQTFGQEAFDGLINSMISSTGCIISAYIAEKFGRKKTIQVVFLLFITCGIIYMFDISTITLIICKGITGIATGTKPVFIIYVLEVSQRNHRGTLISFYMVFGTFGVACNCVLHYYFQLYIIAGITTMVAVTGFCCMTLLPETKYWYLMHHDVENAKKSSSWFQSSNLATGIEKEMNEIRESKNQQRYRFYRYRHFIIATSLLILRAGCGKFVFTMYPKHFYSSLETSYENVELWLLQELTSFVVSIVFTGIIDQYPRKKVLYFVTSVTSVTLGFAVICNLFCTNLREGNYWIFPGLLLIYSALTSGFLDALVAIVSAEIVSYYEKRVAILNICYILFFLTQTVYAILFPVAILRLHINIVLFFFLFNNMSLIIINKYFVAETSDKELSEFGQLINEKNEKTKF